jgi:non-ribosomal peptide synthetase component F
VPLRFGVAAQQPVLAWLQELQQMQGRLAPYEHSALTDIQRWSDMPPGTPLFETLLVFENHPMMRMVQGLDTYFKVEEPRMTSEASYPLALTIRPLDEITLHVLHDDQRFPPEMVDAMLNHLLAALRSFISAPHAPLALVRLESRVPAASPRPAEPASFADFNF